MPVLKAAAPEVLRLDQPPFAIDPVLGPAAVADAFVTVFRAIADWPDRVSRCQAAVTEVLGQARDDPFRLAAKGVARDLDAGIGVWPEAHYHNAQHVCEVLLSAHYVGLLGNLEKRDHELLLLAAVVHDLDHDGGTNGGEPFRLERRSLRRAEPYLERAGVPMESREWLSALVLATDMAQGLPYARACYRHHFLGAEPPLQPPPAAELAALAQDAGLARIAIALTEGDALASAGLGLEYARLQLSRLAREWGRSLGPDDLRTYLERDFGEFLIASFFNPNLERIKRSL